MRVFLTNGGDTNYRFDNLLNVLQNFLEIGGGLRMALVSKAIFGGSRAHAGLRMVDKRPTVSFLPDLARSSAG
jgi:hypothetical protein